MSTRGIRMGVQVPAGEPFGAAAAHARLAEELGYDAIVCSHIAAWDSFTTLAGLAMATERVSLGTAVAPIYHRSAASMAQTAATVAEISGGRFRLGLGVGHRVTMADWHGAEIGRPVHEMGEYVAIVRAILAGDPPPAGARWTSTFAFNGIEPRPDIPIELAALSPAMLRLAGEIADGVVLWACEPGYIHDVVVPQVAAGRERAGRTLGGFEITAAVPAASDEDRERVLKGVRAELHRYFGLPFYRAMFEAAGFGAQLAAYDRAANRASQERAIGEDLIGRLCAIGGPDAMRAAIGRYRDAGVTSVILTRIWGTGFDRTMCAAALAAAA